jgi:hypothetical protein
LNLTFPLPAVLTTVLLALMEMIVAAETAVVMVVDTVEGLLPMGPVDTATSLKVMDLATDLLVAVLVPLLHPSTFPSSALL